MNWTLPSTQTGISKKHESLALQVNDTKDEDRVIYIDSIDSLYTNITG